MRVFELTYEGPIPLKRRPRGGSRGNYYTPKRTRLEEFNFQRHFEALYGSPRLQGPLHLSLSFYVVRPLKGERSYPRLDMDNHLKAVQDALTKVAWEDDDQVVDLALSKRYWHFTGLRLRFWELID